MKKGVLAVLSGLAGAAMGATAIFRRENKKMKAELQLDAKNDAILKIFSRWMNLKQEGKNLSEYFVENGYRTIAIYGMHYLGECLLEELRDSGIEVIYAIDKNADKMRSDVVVYTPEASLPEVDAVVVTAFYYFSEIVDNLCRVVDCPIVSIADIVYEL